MDFLDLVLILSDLHDLTTENLMSNDTAGLLAILLFAGGLIFWLYVVLMVCVGIFRGTRRLYWTVRDMFTRVNVDLELARRPAK